MLGFLIIAVFLALGYAAINFYKVKRLDQGTDLMKTIAHAIWDGADAFIKHEYKVIFSIAIFIAIGLGFLVSWYTGVAFIFGAGMSASAGWVGMKIATLANVRVSNTARETKNIGKTLQVALRGGSVMGLSVGGFALLGLGVLYIVFGTLLGQTKVESIAIESNWLGINFIPFTMTLSGYALGCSIIAMFDRVGGGIYTKAADMGADLVGKTEAGIPEDDPRNPATIADNVGDNVGDVAGLGADLLESFVGSLASGVILASYIFVLSSGSGTPISENLITTLINYPIFFASIGLVACIIGLNFVLGRKKLGTHVHRELNVSTIVSALLTLIGSGIATYFLFKDFGSSELSNLGFAAGFMSPWVAAVLGIVSGILVGQFAEHYTSFEFKPTQKIAEASREGAALTITQGMATGMKSTVLPILTLAVAVVGSYYLAGLYGVAMASVGMLSFVVTTVSVDTYGPIADNAGGISEMAKLDPEVREITDTLDSVGNTTAAIGKGFAIGSATLAALALFASYIFTQMDPNNIAGFVLELDIMEPLILAGAIVGAALPYLFSGMLIEAVANAARKMVQEVRRQFKENPKILTGEELPNYRECIEISSAGSLKEMKAPALVSVLTPIVSGFLFGPDFVGGLLIGTTLSAILLALFTANSGGAWDNAKKYIEKGHHGGKGSEAHSAGVVGDTVGDPLKDTVGPSLDILIKIMAVVSLITVNIFQKYNLLELFK